MNSIEQAREALKKIIAGREVRDRHDNGSTIVESLPADEIEELVKTALASLSPSTPVDGVGAEPRIDLSEFPDTPDDAVVSIQLTDGMEIDRTTMGVLRALASPEAETRLAQAEGEQENDNGFTDHGGHIGNREPASSCGLGDISDVRSITAQAESGPAVTEAVDTSEVERLVSSSAPFDYYAAGQWLERNWLTLKAALHPQSAAGEEGKP